MKTPCVQTNCWVEQLDTLLKMFIKTRVFLEWSMQRMIFIWKLSRMSFYDHGVHLSTICSAHNVQSFVNGIMTPVVTGHQSHVVLIKHVREIRPITQVSSLLFSSDDPALVQLVAAVGCLRAGLPTLNLVRAGQHLKSASQPRFLGRARQHLKSASKSLFLLDLRFSLDRTLVSSLDLDELVVTPSDPTSDSSWSFIIFFGSHCAIIM